MTAPSAPRRSRLIDRLAQPLVLLAAMIAVRVLDDLLPGEANRAFGIVSWSLSGLDGVVLSPLLHDGWAHLIANAAAFLALGFLVALDGVGRFWGVTAIIAVTSGIGTWLLNAPGVVTVGASGVVFGYFGYLLVRAWAAPSLGHGLLYAVIALAVAGVYGGSMFVGVFAAGAGVSWQAHLFGAIGGALAVFLTRPRTLGAVR